MAAAAAGNVEFIRARSDKREYRRVVLPNALECLLISDAETDKAAACMEVGVGSFSNPEGLEGLAHFLEHMLFYASEKYPGEHDYTKYIMEHGGSFNAFTSSETTNFFFDVNVDDFEEGLDRFAQFFIKPLMSQDAVLREIKAVDSEHKKNLLLDNWRMHQLLKHLASKDHPYHKFGTGSWETLETKPKERGLDIRLELLKFYENYSANIMHLVVYGKESLDCIQSLVGSLFSNVKNTDKRSFKCPSQPLAAEHLQLLIKAIPIKEGDHLRILWPVTPNIQFYKEGPCRYLGRLIGHEGEGSIFHIIKELGWAMDLTAGAGSDSNEYSFFSVSMRLTDLGHEHMDDIIGLVFKYLRLLKQDGIHEWIFDELVSINETAFHYQDKVRPISYVKNTVSNMLLFPPEEWLVGASLPSKYAPHTINKILDELSPERVRILCQSKKFEGSTDCAEPWYNTLYSAENVTPQMIQQWIQKAPTEMLHLPKPNIFIPKDLSLKEVHSKVKFPTVLRKTPLSQLWYKPDMLFFTPKGYIRVDFHCPLSSHSPEAAVCTGLFVDLLADYLNAYAYDTRIAGLFYSIYLTSTGFQVFIRGYNDKMRVLLHAIMKQIANFEVKSNRFSALKETSIKDYQNFNFRQPYAQALYYVSLILENKWPVAEKLQALSKLEADSLAEFVPHLLSKTYLECYVQGNIEPGEAESIVQEIEDTIFNTPNSVFKSMSPSQYLIKRVIMLENELKCYYQIKGLNMKNENSSIVQYIQQELSHTDATFVVNTLGCQAAALPLTYLGIPLTVRKPTSAQLQPLVSKAMGMLPTWKSRLMNKAGRLALVKSVLMAIPIHQLLVLAPTKKIIKSFQRIERGFLWEGRAEANGGSCHVNWQAVCRPLSHGGLGIQDMEKAGLALRLRWLWYSRTDTSRAWSGLGLQFTVQEEALFFTSTYLVVGDGRTGKFWTDRWLDGRSVKEIAPELYSCIPKRRQNKTIAEGLQASNWARDIQGVVGIPELGQYLTLWRRLALVNLTDQPDQLIWRWNTSGIYTAKSCYLALFQGATTCSAWKLIWRTWAPPRVKIFLWLANKNRCWTADRLEKRGLQHHDKCVLCDQEPETMHHLLLTCPFSRQIWFEVLAWLQIPCRPPDGEASLNHWWLAAKRITPKPLRKGLATATLLTAWMIWKQRNSGVFDGASPSIPQLVARIREEAALWVRAGATGLGTITHRTWDVH